MSPVPRALARLPRWLRIAVPVAITAIILLAVGTVGFVESSSQPGFCKSCHIMQPYYNSWAQSRVSRISLTRATNEEPASRMSRKSW